MTALMMPTRLKLVSVAAALPMMTARERAALAERVNAAVLRPSLKPAHVAVALLMMTVI